MNTLRSQITSNPAVTTIMLVNLLATLYSCFNVRMADKLFELYIGSTLGLYGYATQSPKCKIAPKSSISPPPTVSDVAKTKID